MSWAKFDDRYDDGRKVKRAWRRHPRAVGLHAMAITYCARHETDGLVDPEWLEEKIPGKGERDKVLSVLVDVGLFEPGEDGEYRVHDYLDYNDTSAVLQERRQRDAERKARGRNSESRRSPSGQDADVQAESARPDPTRPDLTPVGPEGPSVAPGDRQAFEDWLVDHEKVTGHKPPPTTTKAYRSLAESFHARQREGWEPHHMRLATRAAHADDNRREKGYDTADSILRPTKIGSLVSRGLKLEETKPKSSAERTAAFNGPLRKSA